MTLDRPANSRQHDQLVAIVAREPVPGRTKTRLGAGIGMERAAAMHEAFLTDLCNTFVPLEGESLGYDFAWAFTPAEADFATVIARLDPRASRRRATYLPQIGAELAERLTNVFRWANERGYARTVILASDSPQLPRATALAGLGALETHDVVIGRVHDGGYYLIGMRGVHDVIETGVMGTGDAATALIAAAEAAGLAVAEVEATYDIDLSDDLEMLANDIAPDGAKAPATWRALAELGLRSSEAGPVRTASAEEMGRVG